MKKLPSLILFFIFICVISAAYGQECITPPFVNTKKDIPLKGVKPVSGTTKGNVQHSPAQFPVTAFIYDETLTVDFHSPLEEAVTITITNADTGEIIYSEVSISSVSAVIQLGSAEDGTYCQLEIKFGSWVLEGEFMM